MNHLSLLCLLTSLLTFGCAPNAERLAVTPDVDQQDLTSFFSIGGGGSQWQHQWDATIEVPARQYGENQWNCSDPVYDSGARSLGTKLQAQDPTLADTVSLQQLCGMMAQSTGQLQSQEVRPEESSNPLAHDMPNVTEHIYSDAMNLVEADLEDLYGVTLPGDWMAVASPTLEKRLWYILTTMMLYDTASVTFHDYSALQGSGSEPSLQTPSAVVFGMDIEVSSDQFENLDQLLDWLENEDCSQGCDEVTEIVVQSVSYVYYEDGRGIIIDADPDPWVAGIIGDTIVDPEAEDIGPTVENSQVTISLAD